jgi:periplasmic copper chaperone A
MRTIALSLAALLLTASAAQAHIVFAEPQAKSGAYYAGFLRVSHACGDSPTRAISVRIPRGIDTARPQPKPGWKITIQRQKLAKPIKTEGGLQTERVTAIIWEGNLPADQFDQFGIMMKLPARTGPLYFPVRQTCAKGLRDWARIPKPGAAWGSVESPAPILTLTPTTSGGEHNH